MSEFRSVDALTGARAGTPSRFIQALSEADEFVAETSTLRDQRDELLCRTDEMAAEIEELRREVAVWRAKASAYKTAGDA